MHHRSLGKKHPYASARRRIALTKPFSFSFSKESESESELDSEDSESGSEWEESSSIDEEGSISDDWGPNVSSPIRDAPQLGSRTTGKIKTTHIEEEEPAPGLRRKGVPITDEDLRAMALYRIEKGDSPEMRHYSAPRQWREFAQRPEVRRHPYCTRVHGGYGC